MKKKLAAALLMLVSATGASANDPVQPAAAEQEKKICKTEKVTGSRTRTQRICLTEAQWRELAAATKKGLDEMGQRTASGSGQNSQPGG